MNGKIWRRKDDGWVADLVFVGGGFLGVLVVGKSQRRCGSFVLNAGDSPARVNGLFPGDDVVGEFGGDPVEAGGWPFVTVIVPGRTEGHILAGTLGSICAMDYPRFRVVFVDDQSTDNTAAVCRELEGKYPHLTVIHNETPPPAGWVGKVWAVHQAEKFAKEGDILLFADSDLEFHRECLKQMVRLSLHRRTDMTSLLIAIRCETLGELLGVLCGMVLINMRFSLYEVNNPKVPQALVAGGFLMVKRTSYEALGGHEAVRGQMIEDIALGMLAKREGLRVFTVATCDLAEGRMYEGWGDTYRGLKKNSYAGVGYSPVMGVAIALFLLLLGVMVPVYATVGCGFWITRPSMVTFWIMVAGILGVLAQVKVGKRAAEFLGRSAKVAWLLPGAFLFYLFIFWGSMMV